MKALFLFLLHCSRMSYNIPYHLGCSVWSLPGWVGTFYTDIAKPGDFLGQYASVFNTVEGNTTFYTIPDEQRLQRWAEIVPTDFKFCFKIHQSITHEKLLDVSQQELDDFILRFDALRMNLGPFIIQLPQSFSPVILGRLEKFMEMLPANMSFAVEVRHLDFYDKGLHEHQLDHLLKSFNSDKVIFDTRKLHATVSNEPSIVEAKRKKPKTPVRFEATGSRPVLRFVGTNDAMDSDSYLKEWAIIVAEWIKTGHHPYVFIHTPDQVSQPKLCYHFHHLLSNLLDLTPLNEWPVNRQDKQLGLF